MAAITNTHCNFVITWLLLHLTTSACGPILQKYEILSNQSNNNSESTQFDFKWKTKISLENKLLDDNKFYDNLKASWSRLKSINFDETNIASESDTVRNGTNRKSNHLSSGEKVDQLISKLMEASDRQKDMDHIDSTFEQAEAVKAILEAEINRSRLITMHLKSMHRSVQEAYSLAKTLVQSDLVAKDTKQSALEQLDKCLKKALFPLIVSWDSAIAGHGSRVMKLMLSLLIHHQ